MYDGNFTLQIVSWHIQFVSQWEKWESIKVLECHLLDHGGVHPESCCYFGHCKHKFFPNTASYLAICFYFIH